MKYRKKPVVVEAVRWTGENREEIIDFCEENDLWSSDRKVLFINGIEDIMYAGIGDYIIKGVNGEFYPCKPDAFAKTYERVAE
mgnify:CR=1 FL=1